MDGRDCVKETWRWKWGLEQLFNALFDVKDALAELGISGDWHIATAFIVSAWVY
jgi:hypothetical protein